MYPLSHPIIAHHPADPSTIDNASITRNCVSGSSSSAPHERGNTIPKMPASFIACAISGGIRRMRSISSPAARIFGPSSIAERRTGESSGKTFPAGRII
jgi:hypothetical protein